MGAELSSKWSDLYQSNEDEQGIIACVQGLQQTSSLAACQTQYLVPRLGRLDVASDDPTLTVKRISLAGAVLLAYKTFGLGRPDAVEGKRAAVRALVRLGLGSVSGVPRTFAGESVAFLTQALDEGEKDPLVLSDMFSAIWLLVADPRRVAIETRNRIVDDLLRIVADPKTYGEHTSQTAARLYQNIRQIVGTPMPPSLEPDVFDVGIGPAVVEKGGSSSKETPGTPRNLARPILIVAGALAVGAAVAFTVWDRHTAQFS